MENGKWKKKNEVDIALREPKFLLHFPFSILYFHFFVPWCLGGLIPLRVLA